MARLRNAIEERIALVSAVRVSVFDAIEMRTSPKMPVICWDIFSISLFEAAVVAL